jgi:invasion protein IalB
MRPLIAALTVAAALLVVPAAASAAPSTAIFHECWSTPGNAYPWNVTCVEGPRRYQSQCTMMRNQKIREGYATRACRWDVWNAQPGWYYFYSGHRA